MCCFPAKELFKLSLKKEMVLSTTFALAQRHERRKTNNNKDYK